MAKLVAGTKYRGDFEERMKRLGEALEVIDNVIPFIDEIMVVGAGLKQVVEVWMQVIC